MFIGLHLCRNKAVVQIYGRDLTGCAIKGKRFGSNWMAILGKEKQNTKNKHISTFYHLYSLFSSTDIPVLFKNPVSPLYTCLEMILIQLTFFCVLPLAVAVDYLDFAV